MLQVAPFMLAGIAAPLIALGGDTTTPHPTWLVAGLFLLAVCAAGLTWTLTYRVAPWMHHVWVAAWLVALTLMVHGVGGAGSGAALALFLPALWMSLHGTRLAALVILALMLTSVIAVTLLDGSSELTTIDVRRIITFVTVPALAVWAVATLVQRLAQSEAQARAASETLAVVAVAAHRIRQSLDPRTATCEALLQISGATAVLVLEPEGRHLRATATLGRDLRDLQLPLGGRSLAVAAYQEGRSIFVADATRDERADPTITAATDARSVLVQPFGHGGAVHGVLEVTWSEPLPRPPGQSSVAVSLLAQEIGWSIERSDLMKSLQRRATTDALTGLGNRRAWRDQITSMADGQLCIAMADLDHFKTYNDTYGHPAGDALLKAIGETWQQLVRPSDLLVRWGGEEFALALPDCTLEGARTVLERLRTGMPLGQTVSIGLAQQTPGETVESLMARADRALYDAKECGRNRICLADEASVAVT